MAKRTSNSQKGKRSRRAFNAEFKAKVVNLVREERRSVADVSRELDLTDSAVRAWIKKADDGAGGRVLVTNEAEELVRLRAEVRQLRMERDILKK